MIRPEFDYRAPDPAEMVCFVILAAGALLTLFVALGWLA
jgi:hypothetical protein